MGARVERRGDGAGRRDGRHRAEVLRRIDDEWAALQEDAAAVAACRRWAARAPGLRGCARPEQVLERVAAAPDIVLGALLAQTASGDPLAGRVVLQALLPKVVRMASVDPAAGVDDYLAAMWCQIAAYPLRRRPTSVAANLALDTLKAVRGERRPPADVATPPHLVQAAADLWPAQVLGSQPPRGGPSAADVLSRAERHGLVDPQTQRLLRSVYVEGLSGESASRRHGLSPETVRVRCSRALRLLAGHALLLATPG